MKILHPQLRAALGHQSFARARWGGEQGRKWMCAGNLHWTAREAAPHAKTAVGELPRTEASQAELMFQDVGKGVIGWTYDVHTAGALYNRWRQRSGAGAENVLATEKVKTAIDIFLAPESRGGWR
ncbi:hypothetical protein FB451DRAFT_1393937 [Mycena latifolia]|nr:hypothetical protein FB451DRAFT_1393937 [Mycena latifolia]